MRKDPYNTSDDLNVIPITHSINEENKLPQTVLCSSHAQSDICIQAIIQGSWEDGLVNKVLSIQTRGPKFKS